MIATKLTGDDLVADLFGGGAVGCVSQAFEGEFFGGACAATGDDVAVYYHTVGKELLAVQLHFAAREAGAGSVLEETRLGKHQGRGADGKYPFASGVKALENFGHGCRCLEIFDAGTAAGEADCVVVGEVYILQKNVCLDGKTVGAYNIQTVADGSQGYVQAAALPVVEGGDEFGFFKTICHKEKNVHKILLL